MYPCHGMPPLTQHYHDLAKLNNLAVVLYPCHGLPPLARHHHDSAKLNDLAVVLYLYHGMLPLARHSHDLAKSEAGLLSWAQDAGLWCCAAMPGLGLPGLAGARLRWGSPCRGSGCRAVMPCSYAGLGLPGSYAGARLAVWAVRPWITPQGPEMLSTGPCRGFWALLDAFQTATGKVGFERIRGC